MFHIPKDSTVAKRLQFNIQDIPTAIYRTKYTFNLQANLYTSHILKYDRLYSRNGVRQD